MGVSLTYQAVVPINSDVYRKHKAVADACNAAGVPIPEVSMAMLTDKDGEPLVIQHGAMRVTLSKGGPGLSGDAFCDDGAMICLSRLPPGTTHIRITAGE